MSSAHRPTFHPAVGSSTPGGYRYHAPRQSVHSKDQHAQLALKYRQTQPSSSSSGSSTALDDARQRLEQREDRAKADRKRQRSPHDDDDDDDEADHRERGEGRGQQQAQLLLTSGEGEAQAGAEETEQASRLDVSAVDLSRFDDADAVLSDREEDDSDEDADDTSDDEAELQRELEKIRREREAERRRKAEDEAAAQAANTALLHSNPLLAAGNASFTTKRRWDDDVVFKNQSRGDVTEKVQKRFINDSIRTDFHRSFLKRYVR